MSSLLALTALRRHRWVGLGLTLCLVFAMGGSLAYLLPGRAHAATIPVSTCTESALRSAITAAGPGGTVTFGCSGTITLTSTLVIYNDLTLDGTGQNVTLSGGHAVEVLDILTNTFALNHLTIADGLSEFGAGLFFFPTSSTSTLTLTNCTFTGNTARSITTAFLGLGGGLDAGDAIVNMTNCAFIDNTAQGAPGMPASAGSLAPSPDSGPGNRAGAGEGGGVFLSDAIATLTDCTFRGNTAQGGAGNTAPNGADGLGGGLYNGDGSTLTLTNTTFTDNAAQGGAGGNGSSAGGSGGAGSGGGVFNKGTITVTTGTLASNTAVGGVGGQGGTGAGGNGGGGQGGGLYTNTPTSDVIDFTRSTVASNTAQGGTGGGGSSGGTGGDGQGGGIFLSTAGYGSGFGNSTVASNTAQGGTGGGGSSGLGGSGGSGSGGGFFNITEQSDSTGLGSLTVAADSVQAGAGGAGSGGYGPSGTSEGSSLEMGFTGLLDMANSIVSSDPATNCGGFVADIHDFGGEIDSGASCHFTGGFTSSASNTDPKLGLLANNGGPTQTMALLPGSPAIDFYVAHYGCPATDQRGVSRPQEWPNCDSGAYEFVPTTTTMLTANPNPGLLDQPVQLCASVKPTNNTATPTGGVAFKEGSTTLGTATLSGGRGCFTTSSLSLGDHTITASYSGSGARGFSASTSAPLVESIQVQGQDVAGGGAGGGGTPPYTPPQSQDTGGQNASGNGAGQTQPQQRATSQPGDVTWLGTGLGLLLLLLGLGGLGGVFYRASRRRPAPDVGAS